LPQFETLVETGSTNADLSARIRAGERLDEGLWLIADRQTSGRGRLGREWFDGTGNFMGSTLVRLRPGDPPPPSLALVAGLAVFETVSGLLANPASVQLKWPNDLMVGGAKLAGILLELVEGCVVVGIGVNLSSAPDLPDRQTVALSKFGPAPDRDIFAQALATNFAEELEKWREHGLSALLSRWQAAAHPVGTQLVVQEPGGDPVIGGYAGLAIDGALLLRLADGTVRAIHAGDVIA